MLHVVMLLFAGAFSENDPKNTGGFTIDQRGKFVIYHENELNVKLTDQQLTEHASQYFEQQDAEVSRTGDEQLQATGQLRLKKHANIGNYVAGTISYTVILEKNGEVYRYWFTDFMYHPHVRDRYGKIVAANVKPIPIERQMSRLNQKIWIKQRRNAYEAIREVADNLDKHMHKLTAPAAVQTPVISTPL